MVPNLSTPCCNCRYLTRSWKKLRVSWGPSGTRKRRHWSRKLPIVWFLNSWNPQEPLRQSVPETRSPHFFWGFPGFLHSETVWRVKDSKHWRRSCPGSRSYAARSRRSSTASSCWSRTSDGKAGGTGRAPEKWLNKKIQWNYHETDYFNVFYQLMIMIIGSDSSWWWLFYYILLVLATPMTILVICDDLYSSNTGKRWSEVPGVQDEVLEPWYGVGSGWCGCQEWVTRHSTWHRHGRNFIPWSFRRNQFDSVW